MEGEMTTDATKEIVERMALEGSYPERCVARYLLSGATELFEAWLKAESGRPEFDPIKFPMTLALVLSSVLTMGVKHYNFLPAEDIKKMVALIAEKARDSTLRGVDATVTGGDWPGPEAYGLGGRARTQ